jgi:hypothetical protein
MKTIKLWVYLFGSVFLLSACLARQNMRTLPTEDSNQANLQPYNNANYHFTLQFPSSWQVVELPTQEYPQIINQVWFASGSLPLPGTGSRADIVLIFSQDDPSPAWEPEFFEDYQSEPFWLGEIEARRISGVNKESLNLEIVVLAKIGDDYLQALPNQGPASLEYFDQVISSMRFVPPESAAPPSSMANTGGNQDIKTISFEGVSFSYAPSLAEDAGPQNISAFIDPSGFRFTEIPKHTRFDFFSPYTMRMPFSGLQPRGAPWLYHQNPQIPTIRPQIFIFPTAEFAALNTLAAERIEALRTILEMDVIPLDQELPVLPLFNSAQDLRAQAVILEFQGGRGLRFISRYSQEVAPLVNPDLFYTFQGITADGSMYIAAFFPLFIPSMPDLVQVEDWDAFNREYQEYLAVNTSQIELLAHVDFEPHLDTLDALISSMVVSVP